LLAHSLLGVIERVSEHAGRPAIVFGGREDISVELRQLLWPALRDLVLGRRVGRRARFRVKREWIVLEVDQLDVEFAALRGDLCDPLRGMVGKPVGPDAAMTTASLGLAMLGSLLVLVTKGALHYLSDQNLRDGRLATRRHLCETKAPQNSPTNVSP